MTDYDDARFYNEMSLRIKDHWAKDLDLRYLQSLSYQNMATMYGQTGRFVEAADCFEKALSLGADLYIIRWALSHHNYGCMQALRGDAILAKRLFEKAYELRQSSLGDHYDTAASLHMLAGCYQKERDKRSLEMARELLLEAVRILESKACSRDSRRLARTKFKLSIVLDSLGDPKAQPLRAEAQSLVAGDGNLFTDEAAFDALVSYV
ncbi:hypothetical protein BDV96DRAFT_592133 [Lophiotrema nucula]|uniref:Uncharacterized protein n=1 Tax=Lophiotrema nucula TaxID=690887 RepID=A0A6A5YEH7_9PLEO|nr:hypothetical protein BDV96DRAFT_592133 [Lophiotrema nucula]